MSEQAFHIERYTWGRDMPRLIALGAFSQGQNGTRVEIRLAKNPYPRDFLVMFAAAAVLMGLAFWGMAAFVVGTPGIARSVLVLAPLVFLTTVFLLWRSEKPRADAERRFLRRCLQEILDADRAE